MTGSIIISRLLLQVHAEEVFGDGNIVFGLLEELEKHGVLAHVHVLSLSDIILGLIQKLRHRRVVRLSQELSDRDIILDLLELLVDGRSCIKELSHSDIIRSLVQELGDSRVKEFRHGHIVRGRQLSDHVLHLVRFCIVLLL